MRIVNPYVKYSYERMRMDTGRLEILAPGAAEYGSIGKSLLGKELFYIKIGHGEKKILIVGAHHGREYISAAYIMRSIEELITSEEMSDLCEDFSLYFIPMLNPDGVDISVNKEDSYAYEQVRRMKRIFPSLSAWKANANGVDLNRNYPCLFEEKYSNVFVPASEGYKGEIPGSEPEVKALMDFSKKENFELALTFHSKGEELYWADDNSPEASIKALKFAREIAEKSGYALMPPSNVRALYGAGFENWFRQEFRQPAILIELSPYTGGELPQDMRHFDYLVWEKASGILPAVLGVFKKGKEAD